MILSKSARYALRATLFLAEVRSDEPVPVDEIAARLDVPRNYLSKILYVLARSDLLESTRGPRGGFRLGRPAAELVLSDVVCHFDDRPDETTCLLGRGRCSQADPCRAHERWARVRGSVADFLDQTRLIDLASVEPLVVLEDTGTG